MPFKNKEDRLAYMREYKKKRSIEKGTWGTRGKWIHPLPSKEELQERKQKQYERQSEWMKKYKEENPIKRMLWSAKARAKKKGLPFDLSVEDIIIPKICPYLEVPLEVYASKHAKRANVMSLDRIIPEKGYVKGNVQVISHLANSMKNSASKDQLLTFAKNIQKLYALPNL